MADFDLLDLNPQPPQPAQQLQQQNQQQAVVNGGLVPYQQQTGYSNYSLPSTQTQNNDHAMYNNNPVNPFDTTYPNVNHNSSGIMVVSQAAPTSPYALGSINNNTVSQRSTATMNTSAYVPNIALPKTTASPGRQKSELELAMDNPASPLPDEKLIVASGFILSRISFRSILFKKWKQSYWVQYGGHIIIIFRSVSDYENWLKNPYLDLDQREFLVKLKLDFVNDVIAPNVIEYKMTPLSRKTYKGNPEPYYQFKLERVMDFGPSIAGAFASQDQNEVDVLRTVISQCKVNAMASAQQLIQEGPSSHFNAHQAHVPPVQYAGGPRY